MVEVVNGQAKNEQYGSVMLRWSRERMLCTSGQSGGFKSIQEISFVKQSRKGEFQRKQKRYL